MNVRIRQLAEQAGAVFEQTNGLNDCPQDSLVGEEIEKFAELIVRECIQAVKNVGGYNEDYHMNAIKKYFGVEE
jgi:hypothetical protein